MQLAHVILVLHPLQACLLKQKVSPILTRLQAIRPSTAYRIWVLRHLPVRFTASRMAHHMVPSTSHIFILYSSSINTPLRLSCNNSQAHPLPHQAAVVRPSETLRAKILNRTICQAPLRSRKTLASLPPLSTISNWVRIFLRAE